MSGLIDLASSYLTRDRVTSLSKTIGASPEQTESAIGALLPTLITGLARNAADAHGQEQLHNALEKDHDGSILDHLGSLFGNRAEEAPVSGRTTAGGSILDHILGAQKERVQTGAARSSGLSGGQVMKLMMMLAPLIMGILGRQKKEASLSPGGLGDLLSRDHSDVEANTGSSSFAGRIFDQDGDGDFDMMDVMKFGAGRLFGR